MRSSKTRGKPQTVKVSFRTSEGKTVSFLKTKRKAKRIKIRFGRRKVK